MPGLPVVRGKDLIKTLAKPGYRIARQRGSDAHLKCMTPACEHTITIPLHDENAPGTLNDILLKSVDLERDLKRSIDPETGIMVSNLPEVCEIL